MSVPTSSGETIVVTGFPGFLGSRLLPRVLRRAPEARAICLVQPKFAAVASARVEALVAADPGLDGRVELVAGDITRPGLGLDDPAALASTTTEIWHLAAVYDLSVARDLALRVNLEGTRNVLRFAEDCPALAAPPLRQHLLRERPATAARSASPTSTSANRSTTSTRRRSSSPRPRCAESRAGGMPTSVYRPAVVVGDSHHRRDPEVRRPLLPPAVAAPPAARGPWCPWSATRRCRGSTWCRRTSSSTPSSTSPGSTGPSARPTSSPIPGP